MPTRRCPLGVLRACLHRRKPVEAYAPAIFNRTGAMAAAGGVLGVVVAIVRSLWRARQNRLITTYGSSRWATKNEVGKAGLFQPVGVFLGRLKDHYRGIALKV